MSKSKSTRREAPQEDAPALPPAAKPLKPRKGLFVVLCAVFAVWVGFLTTLYFKTVYGRVDPHAHREVDQPPEKGQ
jgi:hypothetical protein